MTTLTLAIFDNRSIALTQCAAENPPPQTQLTWTLKDAATGRIFYFIFDIADILPRFCTEVNVQKDSDGANCLAGIASE